MLRVGLTGELGSGKSTVARMLAARGAVVLSSDEMGRAMMQPGEPVYSRIVAQFGACVVNADGTLNRSELARLAFDPAKPRVEELNAIVHPAVLAAQAEHIAELARTQPDAIVVVESALIFSTKHAGGTTPWKDRFDVIVLVTAPEAAKVERYVQRVAAGRVLDAAERAAVEADARQRLGQQAITAEQAAECVVLENRGSVAELEAAVDGVWNRLRLLGSGIA